MAIELFPHQKKAVDKLDSGSILQGGVGSGKSLTSIAYFFTKECGGSIGPDGYKKMTKPKDLYIITTARKRDELDWDDELVHFLLNDPEINPNNTKVVVDSWNNIKKYVGVKDAFFIFDEQRLVGSGAWVKAFYKIVKHNRWILLTATPGDTWSDYIPVFVANGFFRNKAEFEREHVVFSRFTKYPKIDRYLNTIKLIRFRQSITVVMPFTKHTKPHHKNVMVEHDEQKFKRIFKERWNIYDNKPIKDMAEVYRLMRKLVNSDTRRIDAAQKIVEERKKVIIFYNFNYELDMLRELGERMKIKTAEWNGQKHEPVPEEDEWIYLVQYTAGAEGWNCIQTDTILFYSLNYSYKVMLQSTGRIDRLNTKYVDLYYYYLMSSSFIDAAVSKALSKKRNFHESPL